MMSCKEASDLLSTSLDIRLPLSRRIALRFHILLCAMCAQYEKQLKFLRRAAGYYASRIAQLPRGTPVLGSDAARRIAAKIRAAL